LFTVLIPTYNRRQLLIRALNSVIAQDFRDFEIVVVDDGSIDGTLHCVRVWSGQTGQTVNAVWQPNSGVHVAYNRGTRLAKGDLVVVLGSDDQLLPDALSRIASHWNAIAPADRERYCGIVGHGLHWHDRSLVGHRYPRACWDADYVQMKLLARVAGDKPGAYRRDLLLRHPFPVFGGERFMRESFVLKQFGLTHRTRYVDEAFQYFEYQRDGLSARVRTLRLSSPRGMCLYFREDANRHTRSLGSRLRYEAHVQYVRHALHCGHGLREQWRQIRSGLWWLTALPLGLVKWLRDCCVSKGARLLAG
jgi:glycosyltransferase involved in cell wall biosynthesis